MLERYKNKHKTHSPWEKNNLEDRENLKKSNQYPHIWRDNESVNWYIKKQADFSFWKYVRLNILKSLLSVKPLDDV